jgi:hypothetical protein
MLAKACVVAVALVALSGCATQMQMEQNQKTNEEIAALKSKMHRNEMAILAVNRKTDALKSLVEGPGGITQQP